jgi:hypothetical protein
MGVTELASLGGTMCCCLAVFLILIAGLSLAFRPRRPKPAELAGIAPAPQRGVQTGASLTRMGFEADAGGDGQTVMVKRTATPPVPSRSVPGPSGTVPLVPGLSATGPAVTGAPPPPPVATVTPQPARRVVAPTKTAQPSGPPPIPPDPDKKG